MLKSQFVIRVTLQREKVDSFDRYPFSLPAVRSLELVDLHPRMTYFIGENGSGKSTLLEAIAVSLGFNPDFPLGAPAVLLGGQRTAFGHFAPSFVANSLAIDSSRVTKLTQNPPRWPPES